MFCQVNVAEKVRKRKFIMIMIRAGYGGKLESGKDIKQCWSMNWGSENGWSLRIGMAK